MAFIHLSENCAHTPKCYTNIVGQQLTSIFIGPHVSAFLQQKQGAYRPLFYRKIISWCGSSQQDWDATNKPWKPPRDHESNLYTYRFFTLKIMQIQAISILLLR